MLLERQDVVQPHDVPVVSGGTRAADTSDDDPLSASTLRALPPNDTTSEAGKRCNVCDDEFSSCIPVGCRCRPRQSRAQGRIKPVVRPVLQLIFHSVPYAGTFVKRLKLGR